MTEEDKRHFATAKDAASNRELLRKTESDGLTRAIQAGMAAHARGYGKPMRKALEQIAKRAGIEL